ncbi:unnamed protein product [Sphagnum jensenii]
MLLGSRTCLNFFTTDKQHAQEHTPLKPILLELTSKNRLSEEARGDRRKQDETAARDRQAAAPIPSPCTDARSKRRFRKKREEGKGGDSRLSVRRINPSSSSSPSLLPFICWRLHALLLQQ